MLKMTLTEEQAAELARLRADGTVRPAERDRVEMVALSAADWAVGAIAAHLGYHPETVRRLFRRFPTEGWGAVRHAPPGPEPDLARRAEVTAAVSELLGRGRSWTGRQLAAALGERGIALGGRQLRRYLRRLRAGWRRTKRDIGHKRDAARAEAAGEELAVLANGRKRAS